MTAASLAILLAFHEYNCATDKFLRTLVGNEVGVSVDHEFTSRRKASPLMCSYTLAVPVRYRNTLRVILKS